MRWLLVSILLLSLQEISAQEIYISAHLDTSVIRIGEQTQFRLRLSGADPRSEVTWPVIKDTIHKKIEVIELGDIDTLDATGLITLEYPITITSWDSGYYAISPFNIQVDGKAYATEPILLSVQTVAVDTSAAPLDIKEIYADPLTIREWLKLYWPYPVAILALATIIFLIMRYLRNREKKEEKIPQLEYISPTDKALVSLAELKDTSLWKAKRKKGYYSELTEVLRTYLEERYKIKALEQTSAEIIDSIRYSGMTGSSMEYLRSLLLTADMVKFAKEEPNDNVAERHLEQAFEFIESNRPLENINENEG